MQNKLPRARIPKDYQRLEGSERRPSKTAKLLGPADPKEVFAVTFVLRRPPDGPPVPSYEYFVAVPPAQRPPLSAKQFAAKYGASQEDIDRVTKFARDHGLKILETHSPSRTVVVSGTVAQMSHAFAVDLGRYEDEFAPSRHSTPQKEIYRGRDGFIYVPADLAGIIVGVFGLDNRRITKRNTVDPPNTGPLSVATVTKLYNFPAISAAGQTIAVFSISGYRPSDISKTFLGSPPVVTSITVDAMNDGTADAETTQDICIAAAAAPGAAIAVFFTTDSQQGWVDLINRVVHHPNPGDPICSVLSCSYYVVKGDDPNEFVPYEGVTTDWINAVTQAFQDAAIQGVTVCVASGDEGTDSGVDDGQAYVQYPASDPWVLSVGGTTIGDISGSSFDEYVWNDDGGATGGGVSAFSPLPSYQNGAGVPGSLKNGHIGRGVPDVAANASPNAAYSGIYVGGAKSTGSGTSAAAPLWAGLIARINAALDVNVGFVNPVFYAIGSGGFRDITGALGPPDNGFNGVAGYAAGIGWDACTGWGSPNGVALLNSLRAIYLNPPTGLEATVR